MIPVPFVPFYQYVERPVDGLDDFVQFVMPGAPENSQHTAAV
jgi:hypothetical protein